MTEFSNKDQYVQNLFNSIAGKYDMMNLVMTWGMLPRWQKFMLKKTGLTRGSKGLDVCCGTGELALQMLKIVGSEGEVKGLDFAENMLEIARGKIKNLPGKNINFIQGDALKLPFEEASFDAATNGFALRNVLDVGQAIKEMARVVKPGGRVVCLEVSRPQNFFLRTGFNLYFFKMVPLIGKVVDKGKAIDDKYPAYTWLPESLKTFPGPEEIKGMFKEADLEQIEALPLGLGAVTVYKGIKKEIVN